MPELTDILISMSRGDSQAADRLLAVVYQDLRKMAAARVAHEPADLTLQATGLVHEVYLRLLANPDFSCHNRAQFYAAAGEAMRRILVDAARRRRRLKRGGGHAREPLAQDTPDHRSLPTLDVLAIDQALAKLENLDPRLCSIIKLRCFVGMSNAETARALGVSARTVNREWLVAKTWLRKELAIDPPNST